MPQAARACPTGSALAERPLRAEARHFRYLRPPPFGPELAVRLLSLAPNFAGNPPRPKGAPTMTENDHPKGALLFMLIYLLLLAALWTNAYLKLWGVGQ